MTRDDFKHLEYCQGTDLKRHDAKVEPPSRVPRKPTNLKRDAGWRVRLAREALGLRQTDLATLLGVDQSRLNNWEKGVAKMDLEYLIAWKRVSGVTLDWVFDGDLRSLKFDLAQKIAALIQEQGALPPLDEPPAKQAPAEKHHGKNPRRA